MTTPDHLLSPIITGTYRADYPDSPIRPTREEALADWLAHHRETAT